MLPLQSRYRGNHFTWKETEQQLHGKSIATLNNPIDSSYSISRDSINPIYKEERNKTKKVQTTLCKQPKHRLNFDHFFFSVSLSPWSKAQVLSPSSHTPTRLTGQCNLQSFPSWTIYFQEQSLEGVQKPSVGWQRLRMLSRCVWLAQLTTLSTSSTPQSTFLFCCTAGKPGINFSSFISKKATSFSHQIPSFMAWQTFGFLAGGWDSDSKRMV